MTADIDAQANLRWLVPENPNRVLPSLRSLLNDIDIFLMTPDRNLFNRNSLRGILLTTYRADKPVISFSPAHVKSGAVGSIFSSPTDIGRHLSELLNSQDANGDSNTTRVEYARYFSISTNRKVARSLGLNIPEDEQLMENLRRDLR